MKTSKLFIALVKLLNNVKKGKPWKLFKNSYKKHLLRLAYQILTN